MIHTDIQVKSVTTNPLLKRREILFTVDEKGTPDRVAVKEKLAALHNADFELTFVRSIKGRFGKTELVGTAMIYDDEEAAKIEPMYVKIRNMPKDKRDEARKATRKPRSKKKGKE
ncbi:MAG TPA: 30S ribosomal protein S24e [Candidatus Lokiarchaeia archaeon]|nr:30S ribosomal protein S24e [Candidatus Lokiarchaeia archaeon]